MTAPAENLWRTFTRVVGAECAVADVYMLVGAMSAIIRTHAGDWQRFAEICYRWSAK